LQLPTVRDEGLAEILHQAFDREFLTGTAVHVAFALVISAAGREMAASRSRMAALLAR
jgi:hypothetical protein